MSNNEIVPLNAFFSEDRRFRYILQRHVENLMAENSRILVFIGLNPSTADELVDDPTIRRLLGYAERNGFTKLYVGNLFAYRATDPKDLRKAEFPGADRQNNECLKEMVRVASSVLCGWGTMGKHNDRDLEVMQMIGDKAVCLKVNSDGTPAHPLYLRKDLPMVKYHGRKTGGVV